MIKDNEKCDFDFFISYYSGTGANFAEYLWEHAKDFGRVGFLDQKNISKNVEKETDDWRSHIDRGIEKSKNFILIMTLGFNKRPEIKRELSIAFNTGINVFLFKKEDLDSDDLVMQTDNGLTDFSKKEYTEFKNECDLLQKVEDMIRGKRKDEEKLGSIKEFEKLVDNEGLDIKLTNKPLIEIVIGPISDNVEWLPTSDRTNRELLSINPFCGNYCDVKSRRNFYEFESWKEDNPLDFFLKVNSHGYFHLVQPIVHDEEYWLAYIFHQMVDMILYSVTVMKYKKVNFKQSVVIYLKNVRGLEIRTLQHFQRFKYSFPNTPLEPFIAEFNPANDWKDIGMALKKIFTELSLELSFEITEEEIEQRVYDTLKSNSYVRQNYDYRGAYSHIYLNAININDFGFRVKQSER